MSPLVSMMKPEADAVGGAGLGHAAALAELEEVAEERRNVAVVIVVVGTGHAGGHVPPAAHAATATSTSMRTTDGPSAFATFENARDSARASLGASVFGVTAAPAAATGATPDAGRARGQPGEPTMPGDPEARAATANASGASHECSFVSSWIDCQAAGDARPCHILDESYWITHDGR